MRMIIDHGHLRLDLIVMHYKEWTDELHTGYSYVANALEPIYIAARQRHIGIHDSMVFAARSLSSPTNPDMEK